MKKIAVLLVGLIMALTVAGCTEADQVSYNVSQEADILMYLGVLQ